MMNKINLIAIAFVLFLMSCGQKAATTETATTTTTPSATKSVEASANATSDVFEIAKTHTVQVLGQGKKGYQKVEIQLGNGFKMVSDVALESEEMGKKAYAFDMFKLQRDGKEIFTFSEENITTGETGMVDISETHAFLPAVVKRNNNYAILLARFLGEGIEAPYVVDAIWITDSFTGYSANLKSFKILNTDWTDADYRALFEQAAQANQ